MAKLIEEEDSESSSESESSSDSESGSDSLERQLSARASTKDDLLSMLGDSSSGSSSGSSSSGSYSSSSGSGSSSEDSLGALIAQVKEKETNEEQPKVCCAYFSL